jgi:dihydrodipicolinate reductase
MAKLSRREYLIQKRRDRITRRYGKPVAKPAPVEVVPISKLRVQDMTSEQLVYMAANDERVTARKMAQKELDGR